MFEILKEGLGELWEQLERTDFLPRPDSDHVADVRSHVAQEAKAFDLAYLEAAYQLDAPEQPEPTPEPANIPPSAEVQAYAAQQGESTATAAQTEEAATRERLIEQYKEAVAKSFN
jgi:hypothetical protein